VKKLMLRVWLISNRTCPFGEQRIQNRFHGSPTKPKLVTAEFKRNRLSKSKLLDFEK